MQRLTGTIVGRSDGESGKFECDEIVLELDHGRTITLRRGSIVGDDGISVGAGIERAERTENARFIIRAPNFGQLHLSVEQAK